MDKFKVLSEISEITPGIYISGIYPVENHDEIKKLGIKYILCCVDRNFIADVHDKIMMGEPSTTILYLPYNDDIQQNLWTANKNRIQIIRYTNTASDYNNLIRQINIYHNKPMIEIGYHFIDNVISSGHKILVHCMAGASRSVSLVAYYLMKKYKAGDDDVLKFIRNKRSVANPNESFRSQLKTYHKKGDRFTEDDARNAINQIKKIDKSNSWPEFSFRT